MSRPPSIAARRLSVTLEVPTDIADPIGGVTRSWTQIATLWAMLTPLTRTGVERSEAQRAEGAATHRLTIRWRSDVRPAMRFSAPGKIYGVTTTYDPDGRRRDLVCLVEEVQA